MLLKLLYDFAQSRRLLDRAAFKRGQIQWIIDLDENGNLIGPGPSTTGEGDDAREFNLPATTRNKTAGGAAEFLVDGITSVFGLDSDPGEARKDSTQAKRAKHNHQKYEDFWAQIEDAWERTGDIGLKAMLSFHRHTLSQPSFLRWGKSEGTHTDKNTWWVRLATGEEKRLGNGNFGFRCSGRFLAGEDRLQSYWKDCYSTEMASLKQSALRGLCMITGEASVPIARTHRPMITKLPKPAESKGTGIVSFEGDSSRSYGFERSYNAPASIEASTAYIHALQYLVGREDHWLSVGPGWLCFWAAETEPVSGIFAKLLSRPDPQTIHDFMVSPWAGLERRPGNLEQFYAMTLTAAGPRLVIKGWLQETIQEASHNFQSWFSDLEIASAHHPQDGGGGPHLSIGNLASSVLRRDSRRKVDLAKLNPDLLWSLYRAALSGSAPPIAILKPILDRLRTAVAKDGTKALSDPNPFALMKLVLNRNRKGNAMEIHERLTAETSDTAYNCGRLLCAFDNLQRASHEYKLEGATVAERYFGSASSNPNTAFSILWRLHQHHLKKLRQQDEKGEQRAYWIKAEIAAICAKFTACKAGAAPELPRSFSLVEQGRFALGFYQQEAEHAEAIRNHKQKTQPSSDASTT